MGSSGGSIPAVRATLPASSSPLATHPARAVSPGWGMITWAARMLAARTAFSSVIGCFSKLTARRGHVSFWMRCLSGLAALRE